MLSIRKKTVAFNASLVTRTCATITPSTNAATKLSFFGFYVGATGDVNIVDGGGNTVLFKAVPTGTIIPQVISGVRATNTTATQLVGFGPQ